jgi:transposase
MALVCESTSVTVSKIPALAKPILTDELWELIAPLRSERTPRPKGGRTTIGSRETLTGILFVLKTGIPWEYLPCEMGCGSGMTCWRRLRDWQADGSWDRIHHLLLNKLREADKIDWSRALIDSSFGASGLRRRGHRPQSGGSGQARLQALRDHRRIGHPPGLVDHRRQPQ